MHRIYFIGCLFIALLINSRAKSQSLNTKNNSTTFKVMGVCDMCKKRIEKALKTKGVENAQWDIDTKLLSVVFDTTKITLEKIQISSEGPLRRKGCLCKKEHHHQSNGVDS